MKSGGEDGMKEVKEERSVSSQGLKKGQEEEVKLPHVEETIEARKEGAEQLGKKKKIMPDTRTDIRTGCNPARHHHTVAIYISDHQPMGCLSLN